jgi:fatty acid amide hydrolase
VQRIADIRVALTSGRVPPGEPLAAAQARHRETHGLLNALVQERFAAAAREAEIAAGPLAGVPLSVKECFAVAGLRTTLGIAARRDVIDTADAPLVARLRAAGAVVVGKANVPQAMFLHETDNPVWGRTNHPHDAARGPGGSSGGDAALVAAGVVPLALGNDLAGSLRQPAHACGIATVMPRFTMLGDGGGFDTLPHLTALRPRAGFLAREVADLRAALAAVGLPPSVTDRPLTIGWWTDAGPIPASPAIRRGVAEAVARLEAAGVATRPLDGGLAAAAAMLHLAIVSAHGTGDIRRLFAGERPIRGVERLLRLGGMPRWLRPAVAGFARLVGRRVEADGLLATGPRDAAGRAALLTARDTLAARFADLARGCDAIVCPVSALPALRHGTAARLVLAAAPCLLANLLDLPAGAVPVTRVRPDEETSRGFSCDPVLRAAADCDRGSRGLPVGVQVVGGRGADESVVLAVLETIERGAAGPAAVG